jgi:uncharacterized membrane protein (UPF0127 family)
VISNKFIISIFYLLTSLGLIVVINCDSERVDHNTSILNVIYVKIGNATIVAEVASTPEERSKGLSGREYMPDGRGMLFYYSESNPNAFWMKDMFFAIDIVWISETCTVININENVPPPSSLTSELKIYPAPKLTMSVLELSAGQSEILGLKIGDKVVYERSLINKHSRCIE